MIYGQNVQHRGKRHPEDSFETFGGGLVQTLLQIVGSVRIHLTCVTHENQTNFTYSIL